MRKEYEKMSQYEEVIKMKSKFIILLVSMLLVSCNATNQETSQESANNNEKSLLYKDYLKALPAAIEDNELEELDQELLKKLDNLNNSLSNNMYKSFNDKDNIIFSPFSIYMTLSLFEECTDDSNRNLLSNYMDITYQDNVGYVNQLCKYFSLNDTTLSRELSNSIWLSDKFDYQTNSLDKLSNNYYCYPFSVDFTDKGTNKLVRDFIFDMTHELIDYTPSYNENTICSIINTLYLNDSWPTRWRYKYKDDRNAFEFTNYDGSITETYLIQSKIYDGKIFKNDLYSEFALKTTANQKIKFLLPNEGHTVDELFEGNIISEANSRSYITSDETGTYSSYVLFPKFEIGFNESLKNLFSQLGLSSLFVSANLSNLLESDEPTRVNDIFHIANIKVDDEGIRAAAVTHLAPELTGLPRTSDNVEELVLDRPFAFIVSTEQDLPLFVGAVKKI